MYIHIYLYSILYIIANNKLGLNVEKNGIKNTLAPLPKNKKKNTPAGQAAADDDEDDNDDKSFT